MPHQATQREAAKAVSDAAGLGRAAYDAAAARIQAAFRGHVTRQDRRRHCASVQEAAVIKIQACP